MKKVLMMILFISFSFMFIGSVNALEYGKVTYSNGVNVRKGAGTNYSKLGTLKYNDAVYILNTTPIKSSAGCSSGWYKINYNGTYGYICRVYASTSGTNNAIITNTTGANIRAKATNKSTKIASVRYGQGVTLVAKTKYKGAGCSAGYYKIKYKGNTRYVCSSLVKIAQSNYVVNNLTGANIRTKATSTSSKAIKLSYVKPVVLESKAKYRGTGCSAGWYKINLNGKTRYVCSTYVTSTNNVTFTISSVNVRNGIGTNYKIYKNLPKNKAVVLLSTTKYSGAGCSAGWYRISLDGKTRYICSSYTELGKVSKSTTPEVKPEKSEATISFDVDNEKFTKYNQVLKDNLKFKTSEAYGDGGLTYTNNKLSGLLLKNNKITLNTEDQTKYKNTPYYFAYVLEVPNASEKTTIKTKGMNRTGEIKWTEFDEQGGEGKTPGVVVLVPVIEEDWNKEKSLTITVDIDGTEKKYEATEYKIDLSGLKFQTQSQATLTADENDISTEDKATLAKWGYTSTGENKHYKLESSENNTYKLSGEVEKQKLKENTFSSKEEEGYFFVFNLKKPEELSEVPEGVEVTVKGEQTLTYGKKYFNEKGVFTDLFKLKENCSGNCKITITVDWDGNGKQYTKSEEITIDYSGLTFEKQSVFTVDSLEQNEANKVDENTGWYNEDKGYSVTVTKDGTDSNKYKVSGILPILEEDDWQDKEKLFDDGGSLLYYLGLKLELSNEETDDNDVTKDKINVKFFHNDEEDSKLVKIGKDDFDSSKILYILKALKATNEDGSAIADKDKWFKITVDFDGDEKNYSPYTVTIDYSYLKFQNASVEGVDYDVIDKEDLKESSSEKTDLESYGYNFETSKGVSIETNNEQPDRDPSKVGIKGKIKEQTLTKGTFKDDTGYFVPIKISVPIDEDWFKDYQNKWTLTLYDESGQKKKYTPNENEYKQGWVLVLFRIDDAKQDDQAVLKYEIDFDGDGKAFLPFEYRISYESLEFQTENKVTFEYFDETTGTIKQKEEIVYEGEPVPESIAPELDEYNYHSLDYWYKDSESSDSKFNFDSETTKKGEDIKLKAHFTIDVDAFLEDVVKDLASKDSEITDDYSDMFEISKDDNTITIKALDTTTKLSEMNNTSIPGAIAYILQRGEVKDITLETENNKVVFTKDGENNQVETVSLDSEGTTLKEKIKLGAKKLFQEELEDEENMTLSKMALDDKTFKLKIGTLDDSVQLSDEMKTEYTFNFTTDVVSVTDEVELADALARPDVKHINIADSFDVEDKQEVTTDGLVINSSGEEDYTLTASPTSDIDTIFNVTASNVNIKNLKLKGKAKTAITVNEGASVTSEKIDFTGIAQDKDSGAGVEVKSGGSFTGSNLIYTDEKYMKPLVKAEDNATVKVTREDDSLAPKTTVQKVTKYAGEFNDVKVSDTLEADSDYSNVKHYFLSADVENRWIPVTFSSDRTITLAPRSYTMYYDRESEDEYLPEPSDDIQYFTKYDDGIATFKVSEWVTNGDVTYQKGKITIPKVPTNYTAKYTVSYNEGKVAEVKNEQELTNALSESSDPKSYIIVKNEIDLNSVLNINRKVTLIGTESGAKTITGSIKGQIVIGADGVLFDEIKIVGKKINGQNNNHVITVNKQNFRSDKSEYEVESEDSNFDSIIYYGNDDPTTTLYFNSFNAGVNTSYIDFSKTVDGVGQDDAQAKGSTIVGNIFKNEKEVKSFINISKIKHNTTLNVSQSELYFSDDKDTTYINIKAHNPEEAAALQIGSIFLMNKEREGKAIIEVDNSDGADASGLTIKTYKSTYDKFSVIYTDMNVLSEKSVQIEYLDK